MRVLSVYLQDEVTEWCLVVDNDVAWGVIPGDGLWPQIEQVLDRGLGWSEEDPLRITVAGNVSRDQKISLQTWEGTMPGVEVYFYSGWEVAGCCRSARRATVPVAESMREHGLLDDAAPARRAAAVALDMAYRYWAK